jgi:hypothetical protein
MSVVRDRHRGTWMVRMELLAGADGKRRQKKVRGFATKK